MDTAIKHPVPDRVKPSFVIFDIRALWCKRLSVRVPGCQKLQMTDGLTLSGTGLNYFFCRLQMKLQWSVVHRELTFYLRPTSFYGLVISLNFVWYPLIFHALNIYRFISQSKVRKANCRSDSWYRSLPGKVKVASVSTREQRTCSNLTLKILETSPLLSLRSDLCKKFISNPDILSVNCLHVIVMLLTEEWL